MKTFRSDHDEEERDEAALPPQRERQPDDISLLVNTLREINKCLGSKA